MKKYVLLIFVITVVNSTFGMASRIGTRTAPRQTLQRRVYQQRTQTLLGQKAYLPKQIQSFYSSAHNLQDKTTNNSFLTKLRIKLFGYDPNYIITLAKDAIKTNNYPVFLLYIPWYKNTINTVKYSVVTDIYGNETTVPQTVLDIFLNELIKVNLLKKYTDSSGKGPQIDSSAIVTDYTTDIFIVIEELLKHGAHMASNESYDEFINNFSMLMENVKPTQNSVWQKFQDRIIKIIIQIGKRYYNLQTLDKKLDMITNLTPSSKGVHTQPEL